MPGFNRRLSPKVMHVLCAFVDLKDESQQAFNGAMNEYLLASPSRRRQLVQQWRDSLDNAARPLSGESQQFSSR